MGITRWQRFVGRMAVDRRGGYAHRNIQDLQSRRIEKGDEIMPSSLAAKQRHSTLAAMTNTPTSRRLAITPGTWKGTLRYGQITVVSGDSQVVQSIYGRSQKEAEANATLIADAGTTANACGMLPSELWAKLEKAEKDRDFFWSLANAPRNDAPF